MENYCKIEFYYNTNCKQILLQIATDSNYTLTTGIHVFRKAEYEL